MCLAPRELWSIHQINVTMWSAHVSRVSGPRRWWSWWSWCSSGSGPASSSISGEHLSSNQSTSIQLPLSSGSIEPCHLFLYLKYKKKKLSNEQDFCGNHIIHVIHHFHLSVNIDSCNKWSTYSKNKSRGERTEKFLSVMWFWRTFQVAEVLSPGA